MHLDLVLLVEVRDVGGVLPGLVLAAAVDGGEHDLRRAGVDGGVDPGLADDVLIPGGRDDEGGVDTRVRAEDGDGRLEVAFDGDEGDALGFGGLGEGFELGRGRVSCECEEFEGRAGAREVEEAVDDGGALFAGRAEDEDFSCGHCDALDVR